ncbi:hypothetical protein RvY_01026 [Ramazzottius varieornatus]|uniref:Major facilitator superfamily associated domain-containing protein n=1 Tax=Ramazzottius varieornatus TaxID=947166 RepID=A0A1D1UIG7_RAMVA|nr:hypothetical protein RvY_01026 [Ramazzottius varieornatus]
MHETCPCGKSNAHLDTFRFLSGIMVSTVMPLLDAIAYHMSDQFNGDLGYQRIFSLLGMSAIAPISGLLIGKATEGNGGVPDYSPALYLLTIFNAIGVVICCLMNMGVRDSAEQIWQNVGKILGNAKISIFVLVVFLSGCAWGFNEK